jgi:hypothetical protein
MWKFSLEKFHQAQLPLYAITEKFQTFANVVKVAVSSMQSLTEDKKISNNTFPLRIHFHVHVQCTCI